MQLHIINHTRDGIVVHKAGCRDVARTLKAGFEVNSDWTITIADDAEPAAAVVADLNDSFGWTSEEEIGEPAPWSPSDIRILPCVTK